MSVGLVEIWLLVGVACGQDYRAAMPNTTSDRWNAIFADPTTEYYTSREIPPAYQHGGSFHSPSYNISADASDNWKPHGMGGNANIEFPWRVGIAGGTDDAEGLSKTIKFRWGPKMAGTGREWPIVWWHDTSLVTALSHGRERVICWEYPHGTVFGEVLLMRGPDGRLHTWEVRLRIRENGQRDDVEVLRPFPTSAALADDLSRRGLAELAQAVKDDSPMPVAELADRNHRAKLGFIGRSAVHKLPPLPSRLAIDLLDSTPFSPVSGEPWHTDRAGRSAWAATADEFSVVPPLYNGTFLGVDMDSCRRCHESTQRHATEFEGPGRRGWYGFVRGNIRGGEKKSGIFSWHPISAESISYNGGSRPIRFRQRLLDSGLLEKFDPARHPVEMYSVSGNTK